MFDIAPTELLLVAVVALLVIGPKDLPRAMRVVGYWVGKARGVARQFRSGFDTMVREAELAEMEKQWKAENERIMREHPPESASLPAPDATAVHDGNDMPVADVTADAASPAELHDEDAPPVMVEKPVVVPAPADRDGDAVSPDKAPS
jgi:sec-independent protein translocase protein TatB